MDTYEVAVWVSPDGKVSLSNVKPSTIAFWSSCGYTFMGTLDNLWYDITEKLRKTDDIIDLAQFLDAIIKEKEEKKR